MTFNNKDDTTLIRISKDTKERIEILANKKGLKQVTVLEYLLNGKIFINDL